MAAAGRTKGRWRYAIRSASGLASAAVQERADCGQALLGKAYKAVGLRAIAASCMRLLERVFGPIMENQIRRGFHHGMRELAATVRQHIDIHYQNPKPVVGTKSADQFFESHSRLCSRLPN